MKFENKFIAAGLGLAISFTGTYFSYSWFTDNASQGNTISIGKLVEDIITGNVDVSFGCLHDNDHDEITIDMTKIIEGKIKDFKIVSGTGEFSNIEDDEFNDKKIVIEKKHGNFNNIGNDFSDDQMVVIEITREVGKGDNKKIYEDTYKFQFKTGNGNKLECLYTLINSNEINKLIEDEEVNNDNQSPEDEVTPPEVGEEVDPDSPGANTKPVIPPSDVDGSPEEDENPQQPDKDQPSTEEKPSEPEKPSTGEGEAKPEEEPLKPEPEPKPQPDTPTTMPLDE